MFHGRADSIISHRQSIEYKVALDAAGVPCELVLIDGLNHADARFFKSQETTEKILSFLGEYLKVV